MFATLLEEWLVVSSFYSFISLKQPSLLYLQVDYRHTFHDDDGVSLNKPMHFYRVVKQRVNRCDKYIKAFGGREMIKQTFSCRLSGNPSSFRSEENKQNEQCFPLYRPPIDRWINLRVAPVPVEFGLRVPSDGLCGLGSVFKAATL